MAGGGGRGNANLKQALASRRGGQRGCVFQTSGLATGLQSPVRHNAGSEPAGHVVACGGVSRSGVPKRLCRPSSVLLVHAPGSPSLKIPSAFHPYTGARSPHFPKRPLLPWPHSTAPTAWSSQGRPAPSAGQGRVGEGCVSTGWAYKRGAAAPPHPSTAAWGSAYKGKGLLPAAVLWWSLGGCSQARTAPCVNQPSGVHRLFTLLTLVKGSQTAQDQDRQA